MNNDLISRWELLEKLVLKPSLGGFIHSKNIDDAVNECSVIDAEVARHGRWVWADDGYLRCSKCTQKAPTTTQYQDEPIQTATDYCPNCGAKMDMEVEW